METGSDEKNEVKCWDSPACRSGVVAATSDMPQSSNRNTYLLITMDSTAVTKENDTNVVSKEAKSVSRSGLY